jgi:methionyl-tRNA formyltransferase
MNKKTTIFMGTPEFAVPSLEMLVEGPYHIVAVYTQPDRQSGRGRSVTMSPVKESALHHCLKVVQPETLRSTEVTEQISRYKPELIVVAAYGKLIPKEILDIPPYGCINVHPSLLPAYRGSSPIQTAILNGDKVTGVTIMLLDAGMDSGPIMRQVEVPIGPDDTAGTLNETLADASAQLLAGTLPDWLTGKIEAQPQDESKASYTKPIEKEDGRIDWNLSAEDLWLRVRAFNPWPGCYTTWKEKTLRIDGAIPLSGEGSGQAGRIVDLPHSSAAPVGVECGQGILGLLTVQLEGKRKMPAEEFIRGQRDFVGSILV